MSINGLRKLLEEFSNSLNCVKSLYIKTRDIFFSILKNGLIDIGTSSALPEKLYNAIIGAYNKAIGIAKVEDR